MRSSIFSNLIIYLNKNLGRGFKDLSLFEIGPIFYGSQPGEQQTVVSGLRSGKLSQALKLVRKRKISRCF